MGTCHPLIGGSSCKKLAVMKAVDNGYHQRDKIQAKPDKTEHEIKSVEKSKVNQSQQKLNPIKVKVKNRAEVKRIENEAKTLPRVHTWLTRGMPRGGSDPDPIQTGGPVVVNGGPAAVNGGSPRRPSLTATVDRWSAALTVVDRYR
nr:hypothetical protein [Tanacetum cinerariifolium]